MVGGVTTSADGLLWRLTLRDGLRFHDGTLVLARDCVASIARWGKRDAFGQALMAATDELSADGDAVIQFRLKRPFPLLPAALGKVASNMCPMMPERIAQTDPFGVITEAIGSGPFRYLASERVPGARTVYQRFEGYVPRPGGAADWTAGERGAWIRGAGVLTLPASVVRRRGRSLGVPVPACGERVDGDRHLGRPTLVRVRAQLVADHLLPPIYGGFGPGSLVVARR